MSDKTVDHRKLLGLPPADAPLVSLSPSREQGWVTVTVNWPRVQSAFARAALTVRDAPKHALKAIAVPIRAGLESLKAWQDALRSWLARIFGGVRNFFAARADAAAAKAGAPGAGGPDKLEPHDLSAKVPDDVAPKFADSLEAFLGSVIPHNDLKAQQLPGDLPPASVAALAAAQANVALRQYRELGVLGARTLSTMTAGLKASQIANDLASHSPEAVGAALLKLTQQDSSHPLVKLADPKGELAALAQQYERIGQLQKNFLEASAVNVHVATRAGMDSSHLSELLRSHGMTESQLRGELVAAGLNDAHEALVRRDDPSYQLPVEEVKAGPTGVVENVTHLATYGVGPGPQSQTAGAPRETLAEATARAAAREAAAATPASAPPRFTSLAAYASEFLENADTLAADPDHEAFESTLPRG